MYRSLNRSNLLFELFEAHGDGMTGTLHDERGTLGVDH